jgi:superfamily II DNA/RNA helicase
LSTDLHTPAPARPTSFADLGVPTVLLAVLAQAGASEPFPIQAATLPDALAGRDVLGRAKTGSGKTIAFALPLVKALMAPGGRSGPCQPAGLVLVPTRELAVQVSATIAPLAAAAGLRCATLHGGVAIGPQVSALKRRADIVVATPGRLEDLIERRQCRLDAVMITVLDEADHLADLGFLPAVRRILDRTPSVGQRLLFSATLDGAVKGLADRYLHDPVEHSVDAVDSAPALLDHHLFLVDHGDKAAVVAELASGSDRTLLFTRTKHGAKKVAKQLSNAGISAVELHSNLAQRARQNNLAAFANGSAKVLVATDIAARGIHVDHVALVVHVDPPAEHKAYLHRSGRTARAGATGTVVTLSTPEQVADVNALLRKANIHPERTRVAPGDGRVSALVGPAAARTRPAPRITESRPAMAHSSSPGSGSAAASRPAGPRGRRERPTTEYRRADHRRPESSGRPGRGYAGAAPARSASTPARSASTPARTASTPGPGPAGAGGVGTVKWFNTDRGYGFISPESGGRDVFVHHSVISGEGSRSLAEGQRVAFESEPGARGLQATAVRLT